MLKICAFFIKWILYPVIIFPVVAIMFTDFKIWSVLVLILGLLGTNMHVLVKKELKNQGYNGYWQKISFNSRKVDLIVELIICFIFGVIAAFLFN